MKKLILMALFACMSSCLFAHENCLDSTRHFLLIVRYKANGPAPSAEVVKLNEQHWGQFIGQLAQKGKLVTGFRPGTNGMTIRGVSRTAMEGAYAYDKEIVSSIFVIKASGMEEASEIAKDCPIYEMDGSVEIRAIISP